MSRTNIKALIFDYGGVISQPQSSKNVSNILEILKVDRHEFREIYFKNRGDYDRGHTSGEEYWVNILRHFNLNPKDVDIGYLIQEDVKSWTNINPDMIVFIDDNRSKIQYLAMISNITKDSLEFISKHFKWLELFDTLIFSFEFGINKPDKRIYQACLRKLPILPSECLFVDDSMENVNAAIRTGMNAIHFSSYLKFIDDLNEGFRINA